MMGCLMKSGIATHSLHHGYYVLKIDGQVKSEHRRFIDALRAGLHLKDRYPQRDIKVGAIETSNPTENVALGIVLN